MYYTNNLTQHKDDFFVKSIEEFKNYIHLNILDFIKWSEEAIGLTCIFIDFFFFQKQFLNHTSVNFKFTNLKVIINNNE